MSLRKRRKINYHYKITKSQLAIIGSLILIMCGIFIIGYKHLNNRRIKLIQNQKIEEVIKLSNDIFYVDDSGEIVEEEVKVEKQEDIKTEVMYDYNAVLEISSINLKKGLVSYDNKYNNVNYNIQIIETSSMPNVENGNLILAGHNGNSSVSFFKDLYKLKKGDLINVYYDNYKYIYEYSYYYEVDKTGTVDIVRDNNQTTITLITCKKGSETKQLVFIGYLIDKVVY